MWKEPMELRQKRVICCVSLIFLGSLATLPFLACQGSSCLSRQAVRDVIGECEGGGRTGRPFRVSF